MTSVQSAAALTTGLTLVMDAAVGDGTVALLRDGTLIGARDIVMRSDGDERFFPALLELLCDAGAAMGDLDALVVGAGPGSFTALRVVAATAKGIAQARGISLFAVPSLALTVAADSATAVAGSRWLSTLDALRGERYAALVTVGDGGAIARVEHLGLLSAALIRERGAELEALPIGPDEPQVARPQARGLLRCLALVATAGPVTLASWEPLYGRLAEAQVKWEAAHGRLR
jgi:tRNA threonylcarbamoyladenosine biosynthesis protein TsaB